MADYPDYSTLLSALTLLSPEDKLSVGGPGALISPKLQMPDVQLREPMSDSSLMPYTSKGMNQLKLLNDKLSLDTTPKPEEPKFAGPPTPLEDKLGVGPSPEGDRASAALEAADAPVPSKTLLEQAQEEEMKAYREDRQRLKDYEQQMMDARGLERDPETGKLVNKGWNPLTKYLRNLSDPDKQAINNFQGTLDKINVRNTELPMFVSRGSMVQPSGGSVESPKLALDMPEIQQEAKTLQTIGANRTQGIKNAAGMSKEITAEQQLLDDKTPGTQKAKNAFKFITTIAPDALPKDLSPESVSFNDLKPVLDKVAPWAVANKRAETQKTLAERRNDLREYQIALRAADLVRERTAINPDTKLPYNPRGPLDELYDPATGEQVDPQEFLKRMRAHGHADVVKTAEASVPPPEKGTEGAPGAGATAPVAAPTPPRAARIPTRAGGTPGYQAGNPAFARDVAGGSGKAGDINNKFNDDINVFTPKGRSLQAAVEVKRRALQLKALVSDENGNIKEKITPEQVGEVAIMVNEMLSKGQSNVTQFKEIIPKNLELTKAKFKEFFGSEPYPTNQREWVNFWVNLAGREKDVNDQFLTQSILQNLPKNGIALKALDPVAFATSMRAKGLNPDAFDDKMLPIPGKDIHFHNDKRLDNPPAGWNDSWVIYKITDPNSKMKGQRYWAPPGQAVPGKSKVEVL